MMIEKMIFLNHSSPVNRSAIPSPTNSSNQTMKLTTTKVLRSDRQNAVSVKMTTKLSSPTKVVSAPKVDVWRLSQTMWIDGMKIVSRSKVWAGAISTKRVIENRFVTTSPPETDGHGRRIVEGATVEMRTMRERSRGACPARACPPARLPGTPRVPEGVAHNARPPRCTACPMRRIGLHRAPLRIDSLWAIRMRQIYRRRP